MRRARRVVHHRISVFTSAIFNLLPISSMLHTQQNARSMANPAISMRPYASALNRGAGGLGGGGTATATQQNARLQREQQQQTAQQTLGELSEEQREEINEAVSAHVTVFCKKSEY